MQLQQICDYVAGHRIKNLVQFYGFTRIPIRCEDLRPNDPSVFRGIWEISDPVGSHGPYDKSKHQHAWAFVFEHAEHAPLAEERILQVHRLGSWDFIAKFMYEAGTACKALYPW